MKFKLSLGIGVQEPKILIRHRAQMCSFLGISDNAHTRTVVNVDMGWWLWISKFLKGEAHDFGLLCIQKQGARLCLGG